jgi:hypothetical protein
MKMEIKFWDSSTVKLTEYDIETQTLTVEFKNGNVYEYYKVADEVWTELSNADSIGKYLNAHIKGKLDYKIKP